MRAIPRTVGVFLVTVVATVGLAGSSLATVVPQAKHPITAQDLALAATFGYRLTPPTTTTPVIGARQALAIARGRGSSSQGAYIVLGHVQSPLGPFDQDAWIVTFPNVCIELFGPPGTPSETLGTDYEVIDAATGSWMFGFSTGRPWNPVAVRRICERQSSAAN